MRRLLRFIGLIFALLLPHELLAQQVPVSVQARGGVMRQTAPFTIHFTAVGPENEQTWRYRLQPAPVLGTAIELHIAGVPFPLRLELNRTSSTELRHEVESFGPPLHGRATGRLSTATVIAILETERTCWRGLCPRLLVGGGAKRYDFDATLREDDQLYRFADDQTRASLQLGAGMSARVSGLSLSMEVADFSSRLRYWHQNEPSDRVHDTLFTLGAGVRIR